ncbi:unnamed protein product [Meloidogyne enterolobii]|uniref:Uncharacterized protein n=1 Tax=Meloidogyne enterolobii TaxID=390850 RepID=A0ACB0YBI4_MELEN
MRKYLIIFQYPINEGQLNHFKERMPLLNLHCFKWDEHKPCEQKQKFFKLEPQLYEFQLSEQLEEKWKDAIEKQIPLFLSIDDFSAVIFELEQRFKWGTEQYYFQLPIIPTNIEEMKITRYYFELLFNCAFEVFEVSRLIINPQMIELLFDENITNLPLQIHSHLINISFLGDYSLNFILNHLIANNLAIDFDAVKDIDVLFQILVKEDKFSKITLQYINSKSYFFIIEVCRFYFRYKLAVPLPLLFQGCYMLIMGRAKFFDVFIKNCWGSKWPIHFIQ